MCSVNCAYLGAVRHAGSRVIAAERQSIIELNISITLSIVTIVCNLNRFHVRVMRLFITGDSHLAIAVCVCVFNNRIGCCRQTRPIGVWMFPSVSADFLGFLPGCHDYDTPSAVCCCDVWRPVWFQVCVTATPTDQTSQSITNENERTCLLGHKALVRCQSVDVVSLATSALQSVWMSNQQQSAMSICSWAHQLV